MSTEVNEKKIRDAEKLVKRVKGDVPLLQVQDLHVRFRTENGIVHAVRGVTFDLEPGQVLGIVGESGSGKSVTSLAIMQLLSPNARVEGSIKLDGRELVGLSDKEMCDLRGDDMAMIFQDPLSSLTPVFTVGQQIGDALRLHHKEWSEARIRERTVELLTLVGIPSPDSRVDSYPHEFSGGMRQRVMIAIAIANNPRILICDEPTTALDVTIQAQILELIKVAQHETGAAIIFITHDLGVIAGLADRMMVMYAGKPVEFGSVDELYEKPRMPYTMGLLASIPRVDRRAAGSLIPIEGTPPNLLKEPQGCSFAPRCPIATDACSEAEPSLLEITPTHQAACIFAQEFEANGTDVRGVFEGPPMPVSIFAGIPREERKEVLALENVKRHFPFMKGNFIKRRVGTVRAIDGITFDIREGECLSLVGESGCGKTTTLLEIMEFPKGQEGTIRVGGVSNHKRSDRGMKEMRRNLQMVFQDPMGALDPRFTVFEVLAEPLQTHGWKDADVRRRVFELLQLVGLEPDHANRFPVQFSGGQRQRIGIARALALEPKVIVLDEPVSALDVSVQAGVINLLWELRAKLGLSYLFVAHDLSVVRHISDRVAVMYLGRLVELGDVDVVFDDPKHPYTRALLSAIPVPDPKVERERKRVLLPGDLPSPLEKIEGCSFVTRCPVFKLLPEDKKQTCLTVPPALVDAGPDRQHACHFPDVDIA